MMLTLDDSARMTKVRGMTTLQILKGSMSQHAIHQQLGHVVIGKEALAGAPFIAQ